MINKRGQVTVFVIVAVIIVAAVFVLMLLRRDGASLREQDFDDPNSYLTSCIKDRSRLILDELLVNGGFPDSEDKVLYNSNYIIYLCKNINNFEPCINQYPLYVSQVEKEFNERIQEDAEICFYNLKDELENRNYDISHNGDVMIETSFKPEAVEITFLANIVLSKSGESRSFSRFDTYIPSKIQSISFVVNEILTQEAKWCYFSNEGFMNLYPEYDIKAYMMEDTTKIYTVKNKKSNEILMMATRGCALPAGWF